MRFSFASMIRLLALGAVGLTMLAVGVSRLTPRVPSYRVDAPVTTVSINDYLLKVADHQPRWLDTTGGTVVVTPLAGDDSLEAASCSPWVDAQGRRQVIGRWSNRSLHGPQTVANAFGIARVSLPDAQVLDQIPLDEILVGPPCWLPGQLARVLYVAGDGSLRRLDLETTEASDEGGETGSARPQFAEVQWSCPDLVGEDVVVSEIAWPRLARECFDHLLVASLRIRSHDSGAMANLSSSELWWLQLDPSATRVTAAGRLLSDGPGASSARQDTRCPTVAVLGDGTLGLAFTREVPASGGWSICLGRLGRSAAGRPVCPESSIQVLDTREQHGPLAFSPDGRYLNCVVAGPHEEPSVSRYRTTAESLAAQ